MASKCGRTCLGIVCLFACTVAVTGSLTFDCPVPTGVVPKDPVMNPHEPLEGDPGSLCDGPDGYVQIIYYNCSDVYCCTAGCDCDSPLNGNGNNCPDLSTAKKIKCVQEKYDHRFTTKKCCSGFEERNKKCRDVDECVAGKHNCQQTCINTAPGFKCACETGYNLASDGFSCKDIDECSENTDKCEQTCRNTVPGYKCGCRNGYELKSDGHSCRDIDGCADGTHNCEHSCVNTSPGYKCSCKPGYQLAANGISCLDIDECKQDKPVCDHNCYNSVGSFRCSCRTGYELSTDGKTCKDIDECALGTHKCEQICQNTDGGYKCGCEKGELNDDKLTCKSNSAEVVGPGSSVGRAEEGGVPPYLWWIVIGLISLFILLLLLLLFVRRCRKKKGAPEQERNASVAFANNTYGHGVTVQPGIANPGYEPEYETIGAAGGIPLPPPPYPDDEKKFPLPPYEEDDYSTKKDGMPGPEVAVVYAGGLPDSEKYQPPPYEQSDLDNRNNESAYTVKVNVSNNY